MKQETQTVTRDKHRNKLELNTRTSTHQTRNHDTCYTLICIELKWITSKTGLPATGCAKPRSVQSTESSSCLFSTRLQCYKHLIVPQSHCLRRETNWDCVAVDKSGRQAAVMSYLDIENSGNVELQLETRRTRRATLLIPSGKFFSLRHQMWHYHIIQCKWPLFCSFNIIHSIWWWSHKELGRTVWKK